MSDPTASTTVAPHADVVNDRGVGRLAPQVAVTVTTDDVRTTTETLSAERFELLG